MQPERLLFGGIILLSPVLGATAFFAVAPEASGLGLIAADPVSLLFCVGFAVAYGVGLKKLVAKVSWGLSSAAVLGFIVGAASMVWIYPAQERYAAPSSQTETLAKQYAARCVEGYHPGDRVTVSPRARLLFDAFQPSQWKISVWFHDRGGSFSFYLYTRDLRAECRDDLIISGRTQID